MSDSGCTHAVGEGEDGTLPTPRPAQIRWRVDWRAAAGQAATATLLLYFYNSIKDIDPAAVPQPGTTVHLHHRLDGTGSLAR